MVRALQMKQKRALCRSSSRNASETCFFFRHSWDPGGGLLRAADYFSVLTGLKGRIRTLKSCVTGVGNISDTSRMER